MEALYEVFGWVSSYILWLLNIELFNGIKWYQFIFVCYLVGALLVLLLNDAGAHTKVSDSRSVNVTKGSKGK